MRDALAYEFVVGTVVLLAGMCIHMYVQQDGAHLNLLSLLHKSGAAKDSVMPNRQLDDDVQHEEQRVDSEVPTASFSF